MFLPPCPADRCTPRRRRTFFHVQMFGEGRRGWDGEKGKEAVQIIGRGREQLPVPFEDVGGFAQFVEHWAGVKRVDRMQPEGKRGDDTKISATAAERPEKVGILLGICLYKTAVCEDDICGDQVINAQPAFAGEMTDAAAEG